MRADPATTPSEAQISDKAPRPRRALVLTAQPAQYEAGVLRVVEELVATDFEVTLIAAAQPPLANRDAYKGATVLRVAPRTFERPDRMQATIQSLLGRLPALERILEFDIFEHNIRAVLGDWRPDVIHCFSLTCLPAATGLAKECGSAVIYDSINLELGRNTRWHPLHRLRRRFMEQRHIRRCDAVIAPSDDVADELENSYHIARPEVIHLVPRGQACLDGTPGLRQSLGLALDIPLAVYVGYVGAGRGLEKCIAALARPECTHIHLAIVGHRAENIASSLETLARNLNVDERVHLVDPVPHARIPAFIASADLSLIPTQASCRSYEVILPNKLFQTIQAGLPVAASNLPAFRRFEREWGFIRLMDQTDPGSIAAAIAAILAQRPGQDSAWSRTLSTLRNHFSWEQQSQVLHRIYTRVLTGRPRRP